MKKITVFCLITMSTLLLSCNGVPALAETDDANNNTATPAAIEQTTEEKSKKVQEGGEDKEKSKNSQHNEICQKGSI